MQRKIKVFLMTACFILVCSGCTEKKVQEDLADVQVEEAEQKEEKQSVFVYVCGAVRSEGVYELEAGSRVYEAIEKAGGFKENAAADSVNQAELLKDEERLYVPTVEEVEEGQSTGWKTASEDGKINLNTASKEELMTLAGIGAAKAESIIRYREQQGGFKAIEEIKQIEGIKDGVFEKIKDSITV